MPPHSSRAQSPTETTRTSSPYFSPNSAIAPDLTASAWLMISACTARSSRITSLTRASTSAITDSGTAPAAEKSKRNRPGAFSEPAWVAVSPSASRNALCTMCVAVCAREIDSRRSRSTSECASSPGVTSPLSTVAWCTISPLIGDCTSSTRSRAPLDSSMIALVGELAAALGVERRAVEDQLDLVALADAVDHPVGGHQAAHRAVA